MASWNTARCFIDESIPRKHVLVRFPDYDGNNPQRNVFVVIDTYIKDTTEKRYLFNAIENGSLCKEKADGL